MQVSLPIVLVLVVAAAIAGVLLGRRRGGDGVRPFPAGGTRVIRPPVPARPAAPAPSGIAPEQSSQALADAIDRATDAATMPFHVTPEMLASATVTSNVGVSSSEGTLDPAQARMIMEAVNRALAAKAGGTRELDPMVDLEVLDLLRRGKKINAVKRVREATGLGLSDAKRIVDAME